MKIKQLRETMDLLITASKNVPESDFGFAINGVIQKMIGYMNNFSNHYTDVMPAEQSERMKEYSAKRVVLIEEYCERDADGKPIMVNNQYHINPKTTDTTLLKEKELALIDEYKEELLPYEKFDKIMYWFYENHSISDEELAYIFGADINENVVYVLPDVSEAEKNIINNLE
jgi:hypothetical protein